MWTRKAEGTSTAERRRTNRLSWKPKIRKEIRKVRMKSARKKAMTKMEGDSANTIVRFEIVRDSVITNHPHLCLFETVFLPLLCNSRIMIIDGSVYNI